uniref:Uncharacterized protein n=1 Tax=Knipowitschia caucasica TaxID=637954 RepID=A0AAV2IVY0_KNICA
MAASDRGVLDEFWLFVPMGTYWLEFIFVAQRHSCLSFIFPPAGGAHSLQTCFSVVRSEPEEGPQDSRGESPGARPISTNEPLLN